jgi:hypothetical protein
MPHVSAELLVVLAVTLPILAADLGVDRLSWAALLQSYRCPLA